MFTSVKVLNRGPSFPAPMRAASDHKPTMFGKLAMERWVFFSRSVDDRLKSMAQMRAATMAGCVW